MLIGNAGNKPNLRNIRRIKATLKAVLNLSDEATITVSQIVCLEADCAPLETVIGLLRPDAPHRQFKVYKETNAVDARDLRKVCQSWGTDIQLSVIETSFQEN